MLKEDERVKQGTAGLILRGDIAFTLPRSAFQATGTAHHWYPAAAIRGQEPGRDRWEGSRPPPRWD